MRIKIIFEHSRDVIIPWDYQYAVQSWIYKILDHANPELAAKLHDHGYAYEGKHFKLFCFGPWQCYYKPLGQAGMKLLENISNLSIGFLLPEVLTEFVRGLFKDQAYTFYFKGFDPMPIRMVSVQRLSEQEIPEESRDYRLLTGARISIKDESKKHPQYIGPGHQDYIDHLKLNTIRKFNASVLVDQSKQHQFSVDFNITSPFKTQKVNIPKGDKLTEMIGYKYAFTLKAPQYIHDTLLYAGLGEECSMGLGWVEISA